MSSIDDLARWRLILGKASEAGGIGFGGDGLAERMDIALEFLYGRQPGDGSGEGASGGPRMAGQGDSALTVPDWINAIHELFPKETIERLERDAVEVYGIDEVVTNLEVLERAEPNPALLRAVLKTKHLMNQQVLAAARALVRKVVEQLVLALAQEVERAFYGVVQRSRSSRFAWGPLDLRRTIERNLKSYDPDTGKIIPEKIYFFDRSNRRMRRWQVVLVVDQSGSMLDSAIHSAITASIFHALPGIDCHLLVFDTQVVDLTSDVADPVETLMQVQLGGGTDIAGAMEHAATLVTQPSQAMIVLITDFYEGGSPGRLERIVAQLCGQGTQVLGLAALDSDANPAYDRVLAERLVAVGAEVGAMTPGQLAAWVAEKMRR